VTGPEPDDRDPTDLAMEQASDWFYRLADRPEDADLRRAFQAWLAEDASHGKAWEVMERAWDLAGAAGRDRAAMADIIASPPAAPRRRAGRMVAGLGALALAACLALFVAAPQVRLHLLADHITAAAETETVTLDDGSTVQLAPGSAIRSRFTDTRRDLDLIQGQAFFKVTGNKARPFIVTAGGYSVTVTGTAFDVDLTDRTMAVAVEEGSVRVDGFTSGAETDAHDLTRGDRLKIDRRDGAIDQGRIDVSDVAAWRGGTLIVQGRPFDDVIAVIRRHFSGAVVVAMVGTTNRRVTGVFDLTDPAGALKALAEPFGGVVRRAGPYLITVTGI